MKIPTLPSFKVSHLIMPLDVELEEGYVELKAFIRERLAKGDPGPLHIENGKFYTAESLIE